MFSSLTLCCAILGQGGMINVDGYLWDRKEWKSFLGSCKALLFWLVLSQADVGAVPPGSSGTSHKGLLHGSTGKGEWHFWSGSLLLGEWWRKYLCLSAFMALTDWPWVFVALYFPIIFKHWARDVCEGWNAVLFPWQSRALPLGYFYNMISLYFPKVHGNGLFKEK